VETKKCSKCGAEKPLLDFAVRGVGTRHSRCKRCVSALAREYRANNLVHVRAKDMERHSRDREKRLKQQQEYRAENYEKLQRSIRKWRDENHDRYKVSRRNWYARLADKSQWASNSANRRSAKRKATPKWADLEKIKTVYSDAAFISYVTGVTHHVDHVIPLRGRNVCGLHVENNLQILSWEANLQKGVRYEA